MTMSDIKNLCQEASLEALLSDPICIAVMRCYGLAPGDVQQDLEAIAERLRNSKPLGERERAA